MTFKLKLTVNKTKQSLSFNKAKSTFFNSLKSEFIQLFKSNATLHIFATNHK